MQHVPLTVSWIGGCIGWVLRSVAPGGHLQALINHEEDAQPIQELGPTVISEGKISDKVKTEPPPHLSARPSEPGLVQITASLVGRQVKSVGLCLGPVFCEKFAQKYTQEGEMLTCAHVGMKEREKLRFTPHSHTCSGHVLMEKDGGSLSSLCVCCIFCLCLSWPSTYH